ncbi:unnamed protein product (macronuclear) [Paramecium tetraurelia]|uniref:Protein kinase domain-containing protein n=1 Tax=Paramecium tetraurelia TaxID=5888 RepID=A0CGL2_PARTE|nr:uncharacterized protein GSPATT00007369001 [Paramecium tetraurelia]CAK69929.1 unnamed protein product [Paramecium tetraurelia]|eukprot:XP_001437326.1 hypothetical protein (macronuclear) [Paramecium tetraurelia strain d4-2]
MGSYISRLCKCFGEKGSKVYQQQNSGTVSQHRSKILIQNNSDGYDSETEQHVHHVESLVKIQWKKGELIGQGSFGRVYKCMDIKTGRILAVKQIELGYVEKESLESFHQEIKILQQLKHKNIVEYYGCDEDNNHLSILLEFVGGGSIAQMMKKFKSNLKEPVIQKYVTDILHGLVYLHKKGIIHRDIKGANIIVDTKGVCKLADFGCSIIGLNAYSLKGTPNWMAPEVINGQETGRYSDIWSLGCTIIEMLTGQPPWGRFQSPMQALLTISSKQSSPPIPTNISSNLQDFLDKCLQFDHKKRWKAKQLLQHPFIVPMPKKASKTEYFLPQWKPTEEQQNFDLHVAPQLEDIKKFDKESQPMILSRASYEKRPSY